MSSYDILLIDDDPLVRSALMTALSRRGCSVCSVVNGRDGLQQLERHSFRLVVTDILMAEADGYEVITQVTARAAAPAILAMSGGGAVGESPVLLRAAKCLGALRILEKPFQISAFLDVVADMLRDSSAAGTT